MDECMALMDIGKTMSNDIIRLKAVVSLPLKRTIYFRSIIIIPYMQNLNCSLCVCLVNAALVMCHSTL